MYFVWAVVLSDSPFHRVWSLGFSSLLILTTLMYCLPFSGHTICFSILTVLDFALCVAPSPALRVFYHTRIIDLDYRTFKTFTSKNNSPNSNGASQATILAKFVLSPLYLSISATDSVVFPLLVLLLFIVSHQTPKQLGNHANILIIRAIMLDEKNDRMLL